MAFQGTAAVQKNSEATVPHGIHVTGVLRRIDELTIRNGKRKGDTFNILKITCESSDFQLLEVLDFSKTSRRVGDVVSLPVNVSARTTSSGYAQVSLTYKDRD